MAREAYAVVGAAVGFVATGFNPAGAYYGFTIGYAVGGAMNPVKVPAPGLNEAPVQTSRDGVPITMFWGLQAAAGNLIQKTPEVVVTTTESQGKGGGSEVETKRRFRTFAVGVGSGPYGPISEVTRIWENGRLVYDTRASPGIPVAETLKFAEGIRIYLGDESQLPDPDLEADKGVGNQPYYRGLALVVFVNKDLTDFGGAIPNYKFEVNGSRDLSVTSKPYPIEAIDGLASGAPGAEVSVYQGPIEGITTTQTPVSGELMAPLLSYIIPPEGIQTAQTPLAGAIRTALLSYGEGRPEGVQTTQTPVSGELRTALITYSNWPAEGIQSRHIPKGGTLS
jgi:hypothetical protein